MSAVDPAKSPGSTGTQPVIEIDRHHLSAARIAGIYLVAGLGWIGLSDLALAGWVDLTSMAILVSVGKGTTFVVLSATLVYWLCRVEHRKSKRTMALLQAVIEGTSDAVFVKDREGRYLLANTAAAGFLGKTVEEILGRDDRELFPPSEAERLMASDKRIMEGGQVVTIDERLTSGGVTRTYEATKAPFFDAAGKSLGLIGIGRDVTDRAHIDEALRETDARLREAQRIAKLGSWSWEPQTDRVWWSDALFNLYGLEPHAIQPSFNAFLEFLNPDDRSTAIARVQAMLDGADEFANDLRIIHTDGTQIWIHSRAQATRDANGALIRVEGTDQDITSQRIAKEAILESERRLQSAAEVAELGIIEIDYENQIATFSAQAAEQFGITDGLTATRNEVHSRIHPSDREKLDKLIEQALNSSGTGWFDIEHRVVWPDGTIRWLNVRKRITFSDNRPLSAVVVTLDITDRRNAEDRLREQEMLVREAAELAKVGGWGFDPTTLKADWTPEVARMYGLAPEEIPTLENSLSLFNAEQRPALEAALAAAMQDGVAHDMELQLTAIDGVKRWVRTICRPIVEGGRVIRVRGSLQDITDRKRVESELRASELRYRMLFDSNPHPMWVYDVDSLRFLEVNDAAVAAYGYTREEFLAMTIRDIRPPEEVARLEASVANMARGLNHSTEWKHRHKNGQLFDVDISTHELPEQHGNARLVLALNVTDRKRAEAELQASERRLRLALEAAGAIAFDWDVPNDVVTQYLSRETAQPTTAERVGTLNDVRSLIHPNDLSDFDNRLKSCLHSGTEYHNVYRVVRPDGTMAYLEEFGYLDRAADGKPLRLTGMSIDVTERVAATELLRTSEERLRVALNGARGGVWDWNLETGDAWWSQELYSLMGAAEDVDTRESGVMELIFEGDRQKVKDAITDAIARRVDYHCEFRVQGGTRWVSSDARFSFDDAGNPKRLVGISWDITDKVTAIESLRLSESRYRQLVDILPTAIFVFADDKILFGNPAFLNLMGAKNFDELLGRNPIDLFHSSSQNAFRQLQVEKDTNRIGFEMLGLRCDGRPVPLHLVAAAVDGYGQNSTLVALSDLTERERTAALLRSVLDSVGDAILTVDVRSTVTSINQSTQRLFGLVESELVGNSLSVLLPEFQSGSIEGFVEEYSSSSVSGKIGVGREVKGLRKDGTTFPAELTITEFLRDGVREFTAVLRDITARRQLEEQFRQSQKMEAVGRLAGGVAHDFNNLLTVINGYCELMLAGLDIDHSARGPLIAIHEAGDRAARLTQQLLALSRKSMIEPKLVDLNVLVVDTARLFQRLIGEDITLDVRSDAMPVRVVLDPGQLEQVLMNLVVNARDAMPTGGRLIIETKNVELGHGSQLSHPELPFGKYALLQVTDTGVGISADIQDKIFEPFFTTKGVGKGTGLGLAVVHGVVQQSGGAIKLESSLGIGTTFSIMFPSVTESTFATPLAESALELRGDETVLIAEDEEAVRSLIRMALEGQGYTVLTATTGSEAVSVLRAAPESIDLLVTDVIMPELSGPELAKFSREICPGCLCFS